MLKHDSSKSFNHYFFLFPKFVVIGHLDLSWSFHEASDSWDGKAAFPKSFSLLSKGRYHWIYHNTLREGSEFAVSWAEFRDLDDADFKRNTDLWGSNA